MLAWLYTATLALAPGHQGDTFTLQLMAAASKFQLPPLVDRCEQALVRLPCCCLSQSYQWNAYEKQRSNARM